MASVYKRVRPREGRPDLVTYEARWREPDGRQRKRTFKKKSDADRYLTSIESSLLTGGYVDPSRSRVTVGAYAEQWMAGRTRLKPKTVASYRSLLTNRGLPQWADVRLDRITYEDVTAWVSDMASTVSPSTTPGVPPADLDARRGGQGPASAVQPCRRRRAPSTAPGAQALPLPRAGGAPGPGVRKRGRRRADAGLHRHPLEGSWRASA